MSSHNMLSVVREFIDSSHIDAVLIPSEDPHLSEYPANRWKIREAVSGFTGSAGFLVVTTKQAALWTDSRYFLQATNQLQGSGILLQKEGIDPDWTSWLLSSLSPNATIGFDGRLFSSSKGLYLRQWCDQHHFQMHSDIQLPLEMPNLPSTPLFIHTPEYCGKSFQEKKKEIFSRVDCDYILLSALDEIAWTFNIRSSAIPFNPTPIAYAILGKKESYFFTNTEPLSDEIIRYFHENDIILSYDYKRFYEIIPSLPLTGILGYDNSSTNFALHSLSEQRGGISINSPIPALKSIKNNIEVENLHSCMVKDGVALVKAFCFIEQEVKDGNELTELGVEEIIKDKRAEQKDFFCESFRTIAGYGANGAIVHYSATPESNRVIGKESLLLVDSGGNYLDGTTDITRVFCYGTPTQEQIDDYTRVLKGHIAIARCRFPYGTEGAHIDVLAHQHLWHDALDYGHGTGHGIGFFLCVHEGPQRINRKFSGVKLEENMLLSDEPGLYRTGCHGIRIENMVTIRPFKSTEFGRFLQFETLTLFPYEPKLINVGMMDQGELDWINEYHKRVFDKLSPYLNEKESQWLKNVTKKL